MLFVIRNSSEICICYEVEIKVLSVDFDDKTEDLKKTILVFRRDAVFSRVPQLFSVGKVSGKGTCPPSRQG